ncbi:uncharacterized protein [Palaemon carinicauda]|uniref:uncharacterized protein n=1 Tax=Palaemon carinicauda TaxID=392227 RepID=UPI0035B5F495
MIIYYYWFLPAITATLTPLYASLMGKPKDLNESLGITLHQTTTYNPAANGVVEHFHHTQKASLMSHCNDSSWMAWMSRDLKWCMLNFFCPHPPRTLHCLCHVEGKFTPCRLTYKPPAKQLILKVLHGATHIFLGNNTSKPLLTPQYMGPFPVIHFTPKTFLINIVGKKTGSPLID